VSMSFCSFPLVRISLFPIFVHIMYACMHLCVHVCMYACVCIYECMYVCVCMYLCVYVCVRMYLCVYVCVHVCLLVCMYVGIYVCMHVCVCLHVCICVCFDKQELDSELREGLEGFETKPDENQLSPVMFGGHPSGEEKVLDMGTPDEGHRIASSRRIFSPLWEEDAEQVCTHTGTYTHHNADIHAHTHTHIL